MPDAQEMDGKQQVLAVGVALLMRQTTVSVVEEAPFQGHRMLAATLAAPAQTAGRATCVLPSLRGSAHCAASARQHEVHIAMLPPLWQLLDPDMSA